MARLGLWRWGLRDKLGVGSLVGSRDREAPCGGNELMLCPTVGPVIQSTPEGGNLAFDLGMYSSERRPKTGGGTRVLCG